MISTLLLQWYEDNKRDLPWRDIASPYKIWLSEIILQQTRVDQGLDYYNRFISSFPDIQVLADAAVDDVLKVWQGLGYYTRARNLHATANTIVKDYGGIFPDSYEKLRLLKGIGDYTAAAVASFAFRKPVALVDGNVYRVITRLFDLHTPINTADGKKAVFRLASELLDKERPHIYNQAIMEFGALVCLPRNPRCTSCVLAVSCLSLQHGTTSALPVKKYRKKYRTRHFNYLVLTNQTTTLITKRNGKDIWNSLYEFPLIETDEEQGFETLITKEPWCHLLNNEPFLAGSTTYLHKLSHQQLICRFFEVVSETELPQSSNFIRVPFAGLKKFAVPRIIDRYIDEISAKRKHPIE